MILVRRALQRSVSILTQQGVEVLTTDLKSGKVTFEIVVMSFVSYDGCAIAVQKRIDLPSFKFPPIPGRKICDELGPKTTWSPSLI